MAERARQLAGLGRDDTSGAHPLAGPTTSGPTTPPNHSRARRAQLHQVKPLMSPLASARTRAVMSTRTG